MSPRRLSLAFASLALVSTFSLPSFADAAGAAAPIQSDGCYVLSPAQYDRIAVPANVPAIPVRDQSVNAIAALDVDPLGTVTFASRSDERMERTLLVAPSADLPLGLATLNWTVRCSLSKRGNDAPGVAQIDVGAATPLPARIGTFRDGAITLSPELAAYLDVASLEVTAKERPSVRFVPIDYGAVKHGTTTIALSYDEDTTAPVSTTTYHAKRSLEYAIDDGVCGSNNGIKEIAIRASAHVAGAASDPEVLEGAIEIDCGRAKVLAEARNTRPTTTGGAPSSASSSSSGGCSSAPSGSSSTGLGFVATALALAAIVRRRVARRA